MQALVYRVSYMARTQRLSRVSLNPMRNLAYRQQVVMQRSVSTAERPDTILRIVLYHLLMGIHVCCTANVDHSTCK
jgi:hypothetical protein